MSHEDWRTEFNRLRSGSEWTHAEIMRVSRDVNTERSRDSVWNRLHKMNDKTSSLSNEILKIFIYEKTYFSSIESISPPTQCVGGSDFQLQANFWITWPYWYFFFQIRKFWIIPRKKFETLLIFTGYFL